MTSPAYSLAQDPAYLAFLRASGLTQSIATADAARRRDEINAAVGIAGDDLNASGEQERRGISTGQEGRGMYRSGETLRRLGEQEASQGRRKSAIELAAAGQLGDIETNLLTTLAGQQTRGAEFGLSSATDRTLADGNAALGAYAAGGAYTPITYGAATPAATSTTPAPAATAVTPESAVTSAAKRYRRG